MKKTNFRTGPWGPFLPTDPIAKYAATAAVAFPDPFSLLLLGHLQTQNQSGEISLPMLPPSKG